MNKALRTKIVLHESAGGVVLFNNKNSLQVAILKKNNGERVIPKGHIEIGEKPVAAALREIGEELGINNNLQFIGELKTISYGFKLDDDFSDHFKKVHLFIFLAKKKYRLLPLKKEGFIKAEWLPWSIAKEQLTHKSYKNAVVEAVSKYRLLEKKGEVESIDMTRIVSALQSKIKNNLFAIILNGSLPAGYFRNDWSDVDLVVVVEKLDLKIKQTIAEVKVDLERKYQRHFGINLITLNNGLKPILPSISLDGKVLQTFLEINKYPERVIFLKKKGTIFYLPNKKEIKDYSLSNIAMLLLRNRRTLIGKVPIDFQDYKNMVAKEIRAAFIITKLAIQYFTLYTCKDNAEVTTEAKKIFKDFDFSVLDNSISVIKKWSLLKKRTQLNNTFSLIDKFIEDFTAYVFKKTQKR